MGGWMEWMDGWMDVSGVNGCEWSGWMDEMSE